MHRTDTVVVGTGQAGLATSRLLTEAGRDLVVLDRGRLAERWRSERWDSLRLLTPSWMSRLPGWAYQGPDPEGFMTGGIMVCKLGSYDLALQALVKAVDGGYTVVEPLLHDPWLVPLREEPRFIETVRRAQARRDEALAVFRAEGGEALLGLRSAA